MRILLTLENNSQLFFLVNIDGKSIVRKVKGLINRNRRQQAIDLILEKGEIVEQINEKEIENIKAELILAKEKVYWSLI